MTKENNTPEQIRTEAIYQVISLLAAKEPEENSYLTKKGYGFIEGVNSSQMPIAFTLREVYDKLETKFDKLKEKYDNRGQELKSLKYEHKKLVGSKDKEILNLKETISKLENNIVWLKSLEKENKLLKKDNFEKDNVICNMYDAIVIRDQNVSELKRGWLDRLVNGKKHFKYDRIKKPLNKKDSEWENDSIRYKIVASEQYPKKEPFMVSNSKAEPKKNLD